MKSLARSLMLIVLMCSTVAIKSNDYVMLSPLDTAALPDIPRVDRGGKCGALGIGEKCDVG
jgi:hypothetical protein